MNHGIYSAWDMEGRGALLLIVLSIAILSARATLCEPSVCWEEYNCGKGCTEWGRDEDCCGTDSGDVGCDDGYYLSVWHDGEPQMPSNCVWNDGTCCTPNECSDAYCTSPNGIGGYDCWAGSTTEPCSCSSGWSARMTGTTTTSGGVTYYQYSCCSSEARGRNTGPECGDYEGDDGAAAAASAGIIIIIVVVVVVIGVGIGVTACVMSQKKSAAAPPGVQIPAAAAATAVAQPVAVQRIELGQAEPVTKAADAPPPAGARHARK